MLALLALFGPAALAQDADEVYLVRQVAIDATAESALAAKNAAIRNGQRQALNRLLRRLTLAADHDRLPSGSDLDPADLVASYAVDDEKTSQVRYLARLTVQFQRPAVQRLLRGAGVSFSETRARPTLILPVLDAGGRRQLFDEDNPWLAAWSDLDLPFGSLLPLIVPLGDLGDLSALNADQALAGGDKARFATLMEKYDSASVAVVHATLPFGDAAAARVNTVVYRYGAAGEGTIVSALDAQEGESLDSLLRRAAQATVALLEDDWKRRTILRFGDEASLSARVPYDGLEGWLEVRRRLAAVPNIEKVEISAISTIDAQVTLHYLGETPQLNTALAANELKLENRQGYWYLLRTDLAEPPAPGAGTTGLGQSGSGTAAPTLTPPPQSGAAGQAPVSAVPTRPVKTSE